MGDPGIIDAHVSLGDEQHLRLSKEDLLAQMRASNVNFAIARPMGGELVVRNREGNNHCLTASPTIKTLATANPWWGDAAIDELNRAKRSGAVGLYLHPSRQGFMPTDPIAEPLISTAREFHWPVVFHTGTYIQSDVLAVGELARRNRDLIFFCDSAGFTDMWFELPGLMEAHENLHFIASLIWPRAIGNTIKNFGVHRVLFGSGAPRDTIAAAIARVKLLELPEDQMRALMYGNAAKYFGLI
jgi:predicted TIM-barrel fold metal-dependent hydrolase